LSNNYFITYQTNGNCPVDSTLTIQIVDVPKADFVYSGPYCSSGSDPVAVLNTGAIHGIYAASPAGLVFSDNTNGTIDLSASLPGNYSITNTIGATVSCPAVSYNQPLTIVQGPTDPLAGADKFECDSTAVLNANIIQNGTGSWTLISGSGNIINPGQSATVVSGLSIGDNVFSWNVQGNNPCPAKSDSVRITRLPTPEMISDDYRVICSGTPVFIPLASNIQSTYSWVATDNRFTTGESVFVTQSNAINNTIVNQSAEGQMVIYQVTPTSINGNCPGKTQEVTVAVLSPVKAFAGNDTIAIKGQLHQLNASGGDSYQWIPSNLVSDPNISNPTTLLYDDARFIVEVSNWLGCASRDTVFVKVYEGPTYYVPNAFSPNGDGLNDVIRPIAVGMVRTEWFRIYNRWGQLVFETNDWLKGWDGRLRGIPQPIDNYVWAIKGYDITGKEVMARGNLLLVR
jgi:gliding motility-associated-like protein